MLLALCLNASKLVILSIKKDLMLSLGTISWDKDSKGKKIPLMLVKTEKLVKIIFHKIFSLFYVSVFCLHACL